ncbi:MAG: hypothetical protein AB1758_07845 [Candidatus Eremiobacterota bacterium]
MMRLFSILGAIMLLLTWLAPAAWSSNCCASPAVSAAGEREQGVIDWAAAINTFKDCCPADKKCCDPASGCCKSEQKAADCCQPGEDCCKPGADCCKKS